MSKSLLDQIMNILARKTIFQIFNKAEIERLLFSCTNYTYIAKISDMVLKMGENHPSSDAERSSFSR